MAIGLNCPRISAGASGFMSNVSMWLAAPVRNTITTDLAFRGFSVTPAAPARQIPVEAQAERGRIAGLNEPAAGQDEAVGIGRIMDAGPRRGSGGR